MIKTFKKLFILFTAACLLITSIAFTACKDKGGDPSKDGYTVTVLYPDGTPVKASDSGNSRLQVSVILLGADGNPLKDENGADLNYVKLTSEGKAHFDYKTPGEYTIKIINLPAGYGYDEAAAKTSIKSAETTINLGLKKCAYDIKVNLPDGSPAGNIDVNLMKGRDRIASLKTDAQGKASSAEINAGVYDVILNVPETYGYKPVQTSMSGSEIVINLFDLHEIDLKDENKMTPEQVKEWSDALNFGTINRFDTELTHYLYTAEMKGNEEIFYVFKVEKAGTYTITVKGDKNYEMKFYPTNLKDYENSLTISGETNSGNNIQILSLKAGETFYVSVCSLDGNAHTTQFAVAFNIDPDTKLVSEAGTYNLSFELDYAVIRFKPTEQGKYSVSTNTNLYDTKLVAYSEATGRPLLDDDAIVGNDDKSDTDKNFYYIEDIDQDHIGNTYIYRIYIKDTNVQFPVNLDVTIKREGDATPPREVITKDATATTTQKFADQSGILTAMPCDGSVTPYEKNGLWYVNVNGAERKLVVYITKNITGVEYSFSTIEYMGENESTESERQNNYLTVYEDLDDYYDKTATTPLYRANYTGFIETYSKLCNKDGVYEVNEELHLFLTRYMNQRGRGIVQFTGTNVADGCLWLLACGYYA